MGGLDLDLVILVPVLRRPHRVEPLIESIEAATPEKHRTLFVCSPDDDAEREAIEHHGGEYICTEVSYEHGDYARKINLGYRATWEPLMFLGADDLKFYPGWFEKAAAKIADGIGVIGTNDMTNRRTRILHSTHSLVFRSYVDQHGTIDERHKVLFEGYHHNFVDDELVATANHRGAYAHANNCRVEHLHPMKHKAPIDPVYQHGQKRFDVDRRLFQSREPLWT